MYIWAHAFISVSSNTYGFGKDFSVYQIWGRCGLSFLQVVLSGQKAVRADATLYSGVSTLITFNSNMTLWWSNNKEVKAHKGKDKKNTEQNTWSALGFFFFFLDKSWRLSWTFRLFHRSTSNKKGENRTKKQASEWWSYKMHVSLSSTKTRYGKIYMQKTWRS